MENLYLADREFKSILHKLYEIYRGGFIQKREIQILIEDVEKFRNRVLDNEFKNYGRKHDFKELKKSLKVRKVK